MSYSIVTVRGSHRELLWELQHSYELDILLETAQLSGDGGFEVRGIVPDEQIENIREKCEIKVTGRLVSSASGNS